MKYLYSICASDYIKEKLWILFEYLLKIKNFMNTQKKIAINVTIEESFTEDRD